MVCTVTQCVRNANVVAFLHAIIIVPLAFGCLGIVQLDKDRAFAYDEHVGWVGAIAAGYVWSLLHAC